mgnify:CR=1 FL=1
MLNKPRGYVTTLSDEKGRKTVADLVAGSGARVWPVGRLDMDSEGLLLLTDDGALTQRLLHPSHQVEKEYLVWVAGNVQKALPILSAPMELDGEPLAPARVRRGRDSGTGWSRTHGACSASGRSARPRGQGAARLPGRRPGRTPARRGQRGGRPMEERLQKLISACGLASRRAAEEWRLAALTSVRPAALV